ARAQGLLDPLPDSNPTKGSHQAPAAESRKANQRVYFTRSFDETRIAFSVAGNGPPLVKTATFMCHLEYDWESPVWRHWLDELTRGHTLIRYDERGNGLS